MARWASFFGSLLAHASMLGASAMWMPSGMDIDEFSEDQMFIFTSGHYPRDPVDLLSRNECDDCPTQARWDFLVDGAIQADECRLPYEIARCYPEGASRRDRPDQLGLSGIGEASPPARSPGRPHVHLGPVTMTGQLVAPWRDSVNDVNDAVQEATRRVRGCYVRALRDAPTLHGRVTIRVEEQAPSANDDDNDDDDGGGTVTHAVVKAKTDITDPAFLCCVDEAQSLVFLPVARGTGTAVYAFTLRPGV